MRIVQVLTRPQRRGAEIFALQLCERLLQFGHDVTVISLFKGEQGLKFSGNWIRLDLERKRKIDLAGFRILAKALKRIGPDLVQANASETLRMTVGARQFFGGNYRVVYRNANQISQFIHNPIQKLYNKVLLNQVDAILSVSESSKTDLEKTFGFKKKIEAIPIGIEPEEIQAGLGVSTGFSFSVPYLLSMGAWVPEKNHRQLIQLFADSLHPVHRDLHLVVMGAGKLEAELSQLVKELNMESKIHLIPAQSNPFPILKKAQALLLPSKIEGLPGVILEAMYCRVPVIAYGVGGIPEVLVTHQTGWCIPPMDQKGFIAAIEEVLSMDSRKKEGILSNAFELVSSNFTLEKVARQFEDFYKRLLNSPLK